ncbi:MAG: hypothetical protein QM785_17465 [Pyrinomonadaceae bacterium]
MSPDFKEILSIFNEHEVKYLIVGAFAVMKYSEPRYTKDLDIWVEASTDNAPRVYAALAKFGAPLGGVTVDDFASDGFFQMGQPPVRIDIMMSLDGVEFAFAWPNRQEGDFDSIPTVFIGREDLLAAKAAAARPQDILDINSIQTPRKTN